MNDQSKPVTAEQLDKMAKIGIPIYLALSKVLDVSAKKVREMAENGTLLNVHVMGATRSFTKQDRRA